MTVDPSVTDSTLVPDTSPLPSSAGSASSSTLADLADAIVSSGQENSGPDTRPTDGAILRFGIVTAVGTGTNIGRAQTDATGTAWVIYDNGYAAQVGDRVYLFMQGPVCHIGGQLGGTQPTPPPVGVVYPYLGTTPPLGWLACNGQTVSRTTYAALFAVCGTAYGAGDGSTTFTLPNFTDRLLAGSGTKFVRGELGGSETFTLSVANLPSHSHSHSHSVSSHSHTINHDHVNDPHTHSGASHTHDMSHDHTSTSHSHSTPSSGTKSVTQGSTGTVVTVADNVSGTTGSTLANTVAFSGSTASAGGGTTGSTTNNTQTYTGSSGSSSPSTDTDATATGSGSSVNNMPPYATVGLFIVRALP